MNCISSSLKSCLLRSHFRRSRQQRQQNPPLSQPPNLHIFPQIHTISPQSHRLASPKANAIPINCLVLANSTIPPSQSGDVTVLLKTGALLLIAYLIANFIVPEFIMRSSRSDESDGKATVEEEEEARKNQGFGGKKR